jgi:hypothetical protein
MLAKELVAPRGMDHPAVGVPSRSAAMIFAAPR